MRTSTRSLLVGLGTAATIVAAPLVFDPGARSVDDLHAAMSDPVPGDVQTSSSAPIAPAADSAGPAPVEGTAEVPAPPVVAQAPLPDPTAPAAPPYPGSGMGGDLPPEALPSPPYPVCPITEAGVWWTDPADPYTCIPPGSIPFHEPTPPGIDPELLEPIFEEGPTEPGPGDDCRLVGALQCTVTIMGTDYVVTFADGKAVGVMEAQR